jgi:hypothetical protein
MAERILMTGNDAVGEAAIRAGCACYFGYPITPQNELTAYMARHMPAQGRVFIQAESEIAAVNMVYGASAAGVRTMTSSSSPAGDRAWAISRPPRATTSRPSRAADTATTTCSSSRRTRSRKCTT